MSTLKRSIRNYMQVAMVLAFFCLVFLNIAIPIYGDAKSEGYELLEYNQETQILKSHEYEVTLKLRVNAPKGLSSVKVNLPTGKYSLTDVKTVGCTGQAMKDANSNYYIQLKPDTKDNKFAEGENLFSVRYLIQEYEDENKKYDMFLYDALPTNWNVPIQKLNLTLVFPSDFDLSDLQYYGGQYGAQNVQNTLKYKMKDGTLHMTGTHLPANFGITFKAQQKNGYWQGALDNSWTVQMSIILLSITLLLIFLFWFIGGRDPKVGKTVEMHPIEGVTPADIGYLFYGHTRIRDIAVLIVYLATKGYLKIVEYRPKKYTLVPLAEPKDEERYIRTAYNILFEDVYEGRPLEPKMVHPRLRAVRKNIGVSIENGFNAPNMKACTGISKGLRVLSILLLSACMGGVCVLTRLFSYQEIGVTDFLAPTGIITLILIAINIRYDRRYDMDRSSYRTSMMILFAVYAGVIAFGGIRFYMQGGSLLVGAAALLCGLAALVLTLLMKKRGKGNAELVTRLLCMKNFIGQANGAEMAKAGLLHPDYYYEMLPYALAFSQEELWARKFRWIGAKGAEFYEEKAEGNTMVIGHARKRTEQVARDLKTFCRTVENDYHLTNRRRRIF